MYGLTDNIVAGPAGQVVAAAAGSFMAAPAASFTPAPAGHTPVYPVTAGMPPSGAGYVPIDATPAVIPYAAATGGAVHQLGGSTQAPIPGPQANVPVSPATGGGMGIGGAGGAGGGGGGVSAATGGGGIGAASNTVGGMSVGGGGVSANSGPGSGGGGGGGGAPVAGGSQNVAPSASTNPGAVGGQSGGSNTTVAYAGVGFPPLEVRVGQAFTPATGTTPVTPSTEGFTVTPGGRTVPTPVGYVHPPPASRFHAPKLGRTQNHPVHVMTHETTSEAYQPYKPSYVWPGREAADPPPPFLASDYLKPSPYEPPHLLFADERVGMVTVDGSITPGGSVDLHQSVTNNLHQDFSQTRNVEFANNTYNDRNVVLDNSITRVVDQSFPEYRQTTVNIVQAQSPAFPEPRLDLMQPPLAGGPVMARVA